MEFELEGRRFRAKKLSALEQFHLSRKIAPLLPPLAPLLVKATEKSIGGDADGSGAKPALKMLEVMDLAQPFADALSGMRDQDADQVFNLTLSSVQVQTDAAHNIWMPLWNSGAKLLSVVELDDASILLPIVIRVIAFNLGNFMDALLTRHGEGIPVSSGASSPARKTG